MTVLPTDNDVKPGHVYALVQRDATRSQVCIDDLPKLRYSVDVTLAESFTGEQIAAQKARMEATGRWIPPNSGQPFTIRFEQQADTHVTKTGTTIKRVTYLDLHYYDDNSFVPMLSSRNLIRGLRDGEKREMMKVLPAGAVRGWWERDWAWFIEAFREPKQEPGVMSTPEFAGYSFDMLVIILQDRATRKIEVEPRSMARMQRAGLVDSRPIIEKEIALYCPRRVSTADHGGTHASPHFHYRAEHRRQQPCGPGRAQRKEITIAAQFINAEDIDPAQLGEPVFKRYKIRGD